MNLKEELIELLPRLSKIQEKTFLTCISTTCQKCPLNFHFTNVPNVCVDTILGQLLDCIEKMKDEDA